MAFFMKIVPQKTGSGKNNFSKSLKTVLGCRKMFSKTYTMVIYFKKHKKVRQKWLFSNFEKIEILKTPSLRGVLINRENICTLQNWYFTNIFLNFTNCEMNFTNQKLNFTTYETNFTITYLYFTKCVLNFTNSILNFSKRHFQLYK